MQIAIANASGRINCWCSVRNINEDGSIDFWVINGAWSGRYDNGSVFVEDTKETLPGTLVWVGSHTGNYNDVIPLIQEEINTPDYVMIQPDQYVEPKREPKDYDWDDDIPF